MGSLVLRWLCQSLSQSVDVHCFLVQVGLCYRGQGCCVRTGANSFVEAFGKAYHTMGVVVQCVAAGLLEQSQVKDIYVHVLARSMRSAGHVHHTLLVVLLIKEPV